MTEAEAFALHRRRRIRMGVLGFVLAAGSLLAFDFGDRLLPEGTTFPWHYVLAGLLAVGIVVVGVTHHRCPWCEVVLGHAKEGRLRCRACERPLVPDA